jgi:hypothetical protein
MTLYLAHAVKGCRMICGELLCLSVNKDIPTHTLWHSEPPASAQTSVAGHIDGLHDRIASLRRL